MYCTLHFRFNIFCIIYSLSVCYTIYTKYLSLCTQTADPISSEPSSRHPLYMNISCLGTWTPTACRRGAPAGGPPPPATQPPANYSSEDYPGRLTRNATNKQYLQKQTNNIYKKKQRPCTDFSDFLLIRCKFYLFFNFFGYLIAFIYYLYTKDFWNQEQYSNYSSTNKQTISTQ